MKPKDSNRVQNTVNVLEARINKSLEEMRGEIVDSMIASSPPSNQEQFIQENKTDNENEQNDENIHTEANNRKRSSDGSQDSAPGLKRKTRRNSRQSFR